jgi:2-oxo-4-hydroxy-4-carboxy-5-ureidoimidazoline decarboxylase
VSGTLARWNGLPVLEAEQEILPCCGSRAWAQAMVSRRPIRQEALLLATSDQIWRALSHSDWTEAFDSHPRIGEKNPKTNADERSRCWSAREQSEVAGIGESLRNALAESNREYERRFGRTFIVCATGKGARDILIILRQRLENDPSTELLEAAEEQRKITHIRLRRWLTE